ncbi:hypothetical protein E0Z10_g3042 [Xylaria hypoxylon]|uniref:Uncharacterized protein n=1 Tax=Xylaria hypoxylon TaxID=37992 RepID=A0A4Z0YP36_9PEZI|nr:hypothetical protein E0Z10_g3042 [Xylaria hypoxylon]
MTPSESDLNQSLAWDSLVRRSIEFWDVLIQDEKGLEKSVLKGFTGLDDFLGPPKEIPGQGSITPMFWFFQRRESFLSQKTMTKWSRDRLDDYILLPATPGFVMRTDCFFVSHFWRTQDDPDPDGTYLRRLQKELRPQPWSYIWTDWTCTPQAPRNEKEEYYFTRTLQTISGIIRNCGFAWFYPPFEPRMWILYEIAEYSLTCDGGIEIFEDNREFSEHINEMLQVGVRPTLEKHGYRCTHDRDQEFLTAWLEALVLFKTLHFSVDDIRRFQDQITWHPSVQVLYMNTINGLVVLQRYEGTLTFGGRCYTFTPFPNWEDGKYSTNTNLGS